MEDAEKILEDTFARMRARVRAEDLPYLEDMIRRKRGELQERVLDRIFARMRARVPEKDLPYFEVMIRRRRAEFLARLATPPVEASPDLLGPAARLKANLAAIAVLRAAPKSLTPEQRRTLLSFSDWGGLSPTRAQVPPALAPTEFELAHGYLTPTLLTEAIGDVVCALLPGLAGLDGVVRVLDPCVGTGRFVRSLGPPRCRPGDRVKLRWITVEPWPLTSALFTALHPDTEHFHMSLERWVREHAPRYQGTLNLVLCDPRRAERRIGDDPAHREPDAFAYHVARSLDLLVPGGLGVVLAPHELLEGATQQSLRERLLRRHHLSAAFRIGGPASGHELVDLVFWRSRGAELRALDRDDRFIAEGRYFLEHPEHVLADFAGLPALDERPTCSECARRPIARPNPTLDTDADLTLLQRGAVALGARVARFRGLDPDKRATLWPELHAALVTFAWNNGLARPDLLRRPDQANPEVDALLGAFQGEQVAPDLAARPPERLLYHAQTNDIVAQAETLARHRPRVRLDELLRFHAERGGTRTPDDVLETLFAAGWYRDENDLVPAATYLSGTDLWDKYDRARARAGEGDKRAAEQANALLQVIRPAVFEDIADLSPAHGYVPLGLLSEFLTSLVGRVQLIRKGGRVEVNSGRNQGDGLALLAWINHDRFSPEEGVGPVAERRRDKIAEFEDRFREWLTEAPQHRAALLDAYNRAYRGRVARTYASEPLELARWGADAPVLMPHQVAAARRIVDQGKGLLALAVGTGKTLTAIAAIARLRQEGRVKRPVVLVPGTLAWQWADTFACALPDYFVPVIGSVRTRGEDGALAARVDSPEERAQKWAMLRAGLADAVIVTYDAFAITRIGEAAVRDHAQAVDAIQRSKGPDLSAWVREMTQPPRRRSFDPGVVWDELNVDLLVVDEAANFKNLYMPEERDGGRPRFMGAGRAGSQRAWQLDVRASVVRRAAGQGRGVVLLTATPAKNSPLEFYNLFQLLDPEIFRRAGIYDPEQFIDRFLQIEERAALTSAFTAKIGPACVGFKNLGDLRGVLLSYAEFRTAEEVGIDLPQPKVEHVHVRMNDEQERLYADYVAQIQGSLRSRPERGRILGILARLSLIALHPALEDGYDFHSALQGGGAEREVSVDARAYFEEKGWTVPLGAAAEDRDEDSDEGATILVRRILPQPVYAAPKLVACAERIAASAQCGHIVFCEPTATHVWLREVLVAHGIPRQRIAIINGKATDPQERLDIARGFNGLVGLVSGEYDACARPPEFAVSPAYDVVILNSVGQEGVDLQVRTCAVHHLDLPWTSADLEQRNGRAFRKGNTRGTVTIDYYLAEGSTDGYRLSLIEGKAHWLRELFASQVRETSNPTAQQDLSPEELLYAIARDKEQMRQVIDEKRRRDDEAARRKTIAAASRLLREASVRFRDARGAQDGELARRLRDEAEARLAELGRLSPDVWPWAPWMYQARDKELVVQSDTGAPLWDGLRVVMVRNHDADRPLEFGAVLPGRIPTIGRREHGSLRWIALSAETPLGLHPDDYPRDGESPRRWPEDDDEVILGGLDEAAEIGQENGGAAVIAWLGLWRASQAWLERWWPRLASFVASLRTKSPLPVRVGGKLDLQAPPLRKDQVLLPPSRTGFTRFLELAPASGLPLVELERASLSWFGRPLPPEVTAPGAEPAPPPTPAPVEPAPPPSVHTDSAATPASVDPAPPPTAVPTPAPRRRGRGLLPPGME